VRHRSCFLRTPLRALRPLPGPRVRNSTKRSWQSMKGSCQEGSGRRPCLPNRRARDPTHVGDHIWRLFAGAFTFRSQINPTLVIRVMDINAAQPAEPPAVRADIGTGQLMPSDALEFRVRPEVRHGRIRMSRVWMSLVGIFNFAILASSAYVLLPVLKSGSLAMVALYAWGALFLMLDLWMMKTQATSSRSDVDAVVASSRGLEFLNTTDRHIFDPLKVERLQVPWADVTALQHQSVDAESKMYHGVLIELSTPYMGSNRFAVLGEVKEETALAWISKASALRSTAAASS
jgi:hypothetical protein